MLIVWLRISKNSLSTILCCLVESFETIMATVVALDLLGIPRLADSSMVLTAS